MNLIHTLVVALLCASSSAQDQAVLSGRVLNKDGQPVAKAQVLIIGTRSQTITSQDGTFSFSDLEQGPATIIAKHEHFGEVLTTLEINDQKLEIELVLDIRIHNTVVVTGNLISENLADSFTTPESLDHHELRMRQDSNLGETLKNGPGVDSTSYVPGAGRPIIRGLGGDRIRILENGMGIGDASSTSPDHAVSTSTANADSVEVLRGPATLQFGTNAMGGVVNVIDQKIPAHNLSSSLAGTVGLQAADNADEREANFSLGGNVNDFNWTLNFDWRDADNIEVPEGALEEEDHEDEHHEDEHEDEHEEHEEHGTELENSFSETQNIALGFSKVFDRGYFGFSYAQNESKYGVPGHAHAHGDEHEHEDEHGEDEHEEEEHEDEHGEEEVSIDLEQSRFDFKGTWETDGFLKHIQSNLAFIQYEHTELEGEEIGTVFENDYQEFRLDAKHKRIGPFEGKIGLSISQREFEAVGEEAFIPKSDTQKIGLYALEEWRSGSNRFNWGVRAEHQDLDAEATEHHHEEEHEHEGEEEEEEHEEEHLEDIQRNDSVAAFSFGWTRKFEEHSSFVANFNLVNRQPNAEELLSNGPHLATQSFELGNPDLKDERGTHIDLSYRRHQGRVTGEINVFTTDYKDFIYQDRLDEEEDGLPVYQYTQDDATFKGGEIHLDWELFHQGPHHLNLETNYDLVRAETDDENLPRIPANKLLLALDYKSPHWIARTELVNYADQDRTAHDESETEGYDLISAWVGFHFHKAGHVHQIMLRGTNLTDEIGRPHTSFLKELVPLQGRKIRLTYQWSF